MIFGLVTILGLLTWPLAANLPPGYIVLNDMHIHETYKQSTEQLTWLCAHAAALKRANVQFIVLNGDLTDSGSPLFSLLGPGQRPGEWKILAATLENCVQQFPVFPVPGNHDRFMVESYAHETNAHEREFTSEILSRHAIEIDRFQGNYALEISGRHFVFLDNSAFGVNRHFWARTSQGQLQWLDRKLSEISCKKCVTIFSHFPTGTFAPSDRRRLLEVIGNFAEKISTYHSGHIHRMFGSRAFAKLNFPTGDEISELSLADFVSTGLIRWIPLHAPLTETGNPAIRDFQVKELRRQADVDAFIAARIENPENSYEVAPFTGWKQQWFLSIYETLHYACLAIYVMLIGILHAFWKYNKSGRSLPSGTPVVNNLIVIFGLLMPVMPWAIGYGWPREDGSQELVVAGIWGQISLTTGERRQMDLITLHVIPLLLRTAFKCLMIYTSRSAHFLGKAAHYISMAIVFLITVVGIKLLVLTYGPFLFLSPLAIWELFCWGRKFHAFYLERKHKSI